MLLFNDELLGMSLTLIPIALDLVEIREVEVLDGFLEFARLQRCLQVAQRLCQALPFGRGLSEKTTEFVKIAVSHAAVCVWMLFL